MRASELCGEVFSSKDQPISSAEANTLLQDLLGEITLARKAPSQLGKSWADAAVKSQSLLDPDLLANLKELGIPSRR